MRNADCGMRIGECQCEVHPPRRAAGKRYGGARNGLICAYLWESVAGFAVLAAQAGSKPANGQGYFETNPFRRKWLKKRNLRRESMFSDVLRRLPMATRRLRRTCSSHSLRPFAGRFGPEPGSRCVENARSAVTLRRSSDGGEESVR